MNRRTVLLVFFVAACAGGGTTVQTGTGAIPAPVGPAPVVYNPVQSREFPELSGPTKDRARGRRGQLKQRSPQMIFEPGSIKSPTTQ